MWLRAIASHFFVFILKWVCFFLSISKQLRANRWATVIKRFNCCLSTFLCETVFFLTKLNENEPDVSLSQSINKCVCNCKWKTSVKQCGWLCCVCVRCGGECLTRNTSKMVFVGQTGKTIEFPLCVSSNSEKKRASTKSISRWLKCALAVRKRCGVNEDNRHGTPWAKTYLPMVSTIQGRIPKHKVWTNTMKHAYFALITQSNWNYEFWLQTIQFLKQITIANGISM